MELCNIISGNGLLPVWWQAITQGSTYLLSSGVLEIICNGILVEMQGISFNNMHLKMLKYCLQYVGDFVKALVL